MIERPERHVRGLRRGGRRQHHRPRRGHAARPLRRAGDPRGRLHARASRSARRRRWRRSRRSRRASAVLCMTVNPGWGGQAFIAASLDKIRRLRALVGPRRGARGRRRDRRATRPARAPTAGATLFVAGTAVFGDRGSRRAGLPQRSPPRPGVRLAVCGDPDGRTRIRYTWHAPSSSSTTTRPSGRPPAMLLEAEGYDVIGEAPDGTSAITEACRLHPDLVLLDVNLPDIDGFEVAAADHRPHRRSGRGPRSPAATRRTSVRSCPRSGARGFIPKAELSGASACRSCSESAHARPAPRAARALRPRGDAVAGLDVALALTSTTRARRSSPPSSARSSG